MKLPEKVRVGETLSARWLNQVVDCLKELGKAANVSSNGSSTSSIEYSGSDIRDTKYRGTRGTDLQEFRVSPFQLRLKPKHLCEVDEDGNWEKVAQMKVGAIVDYTGKTHPVPADEPLYDYAEGWVDIGSFTEELQKAYCIITQNYKGEITKVEIKKEEQKFVPWGKTDANAEGEGVLSVFIGSYQLNMIQEVNRAHIYQAHTGTLDLQTVQIEKIFDAAEELKEGSTGSGEAAEESYYTAPESEEYESAPAGLFRKRDEHLFIFKKLICGEGLSLMDGKNLKIKLRRANSGWPDGSGSQESLQEGEPVITLGGVEDIVFSEGAIMPEIESGIIKVPFADTVNDVKGVISGLEVRYVPAVREDDGSITFLGEDGSRQPQGRNAPGEESGSGSNEGPYTNEIVKGVIHLSIPIIVDEASASMSMSESMEESESSSGSDIGSGTASGSGSATDSSSADTDSSSTDTGSSGGSSSSGGGSSTDGSVPSDGSASGSSGSSSCGCGCEAKLAEMSARIDALEARLAALENKECNCKCGDLLGQIQAAVAAEAQAIANSINYEVSVNGAVVANTEYGTLVADTTGTVTAGGASASSNIHY